MIIFAKTDTEKKTKMDVSFFAETAKYFDYQ